MKEDLNKCKDTPYPWTGRFKFIKCQFSKICRFTAVPIKITMAIFAEIGKLILKFIWNCRRPQISKTIWKRKIEVGELKLPDFKTYYNATVIGTVEY